MRLYNARVPTTRINPVHIRAQRAPRTRSALVLLNTAAIPLSTALNHARIIPRHTAPPRVIPRHPAPVPC